VSSFLYFGNVNIEIFPVDIDTLKKLVKSVNDFHVVIKEVLVEIIQVHIPFNLIIILVTIVQIIVAEQNFEVLFMLEIPDAHFFRRQGLSFG
jgi:hypothetical protein